MSRTRRDFMWAAGLGVGALALGRRAAAEPFRLGRPRMLLQISPQGGIDSLLTTDPKTVKQVDRRIDVPYPESAITTAGSSRIAPMMRPLARHVPSMAILNGVLNGTVSHFTGSAQLQQCRRMYPPGSPGLAGMIGALRRGDAPLEQVVWGQEDMYQVPVGRALWDNTDALVEQLSFLARRDGARRAIKDELAGQIARSTGDRRVALEVTYGLLDRMAGLELPKPVVLELPPPSAFPAVAKAVDEDWSRRIRDIVFLFKHRLTGAIFIQAPGSNWDSHQDNLLKQQWCMDRFAPHLDRLLTLFAQERTDDGVPLSEQVGILISSDMGRYPFVNELKGKDHFPEAPAMLIGPGIRPGQYGDTDDKLMSQPISRATGRPSSSPSDIVPTLDDLGATVMSWFGVDDPIAFGFAGRRLDFLLA